MRPFSHITLVHVSHDLTSYWDNVGGETLEAAIDFAVPHSRIIVRSTWLPLCLHHSSPWSCDAQVCGSISTYNTAEPYNVKNLQLLLWKDIHMYGFLVSTLTEKWGDEFSRTMPTRVARGEVKYKEHIVRGLENAPQAIVDLHLGNNFGKSVLVVADE